MAVPFLAQPDPNVSDGSAFPSRRPVLVALEGGRSPRALARRRMFVQRRIFVAVVAVAALASGASIVSSFSGAPAAATAVSSTYEVGAGDTLWSIAGSLDVDVDRRVAVELLARANGGTVVRPGQELVIPAELTALAG